MSIKYANKTYGTNFKIGQAIKYPAFGEMYEGMITSATNYIVIKPCIDPKLRLRFHPMDIKAL